MMDVSDAKREAVAHLRAVMGSRSVGPVPSLGPPAMYASGMGRRWIGLFWRPAFEPGRIFFVHAEEIDQVFDAEVGECRDTILPRRRKPR